MSGNHKRKQRNMIRNWRYKAIGRLMIVLIKLNINHSKMFKPRPFGDPLFDFVCKWEDSR